MPVKSDNDIYIIHNIYKDGELCLYKVKLNGTESKTKYNILFLKEKHFNDNSITIEVLNGVQDLKRAKKEVNDYLNGVTAEEKVYSFVDTDKKEVKQGTFIKVIKSIPLNISIYSVPVGDIYECTTEATEKANYLFHLLGKRGEKLSTYNANGFNKILLGFRPSLVEKLFAEGYIIMVDRIEQTKGELTQQPEKVITAQEEESTNEVIYEEEITGEVQGQTQEEEQTITNNNEVEVIYNTEKQGIELKFTDKPSHEVLEQLKINGFRWSKFQKMWYAKDTPDRRKFAESFNSEAITAEGKTFDYPEIDINDIETYTINEELQRREHDSHWIFRKKERNHTQEIQDYYRELNNRIIEIESQTDNKEIIYHLKKSIQRYKKQYFDNYVKRLRNKADNPSWAVTGLSGRNVRRAEKLNNRYNNLMRENIQLEEDLKTAFHRAENAIRREKKKQLEENINNTTSTITFKAKQEYLEGWGTVRMYRYKNYAICKNWGCYRVYKDGKEIYSCKSTDKLEVAIKYVSMLLNRQETA